MRKLLISLILLSASTAFAATSYINFPRFPITGSLFTTGLTAWWTFDGKDMVSNINDATGNASNGYLVNFTSTTTAPGQYGQALTLNGSNQFATVTDATAVRVGPTNLTISGWFKSNGFAAQQTVISKGQNGPPWSSPFLSYMIRVNSATAIEFDVGTSATYSAYAQNLPAGNSLQTGKWYMATMTWDGSTVRSYLNGQVLGTKAFTSTGLVNYTSKPTIIGADFGASPTTSNFNGQLDDIRMWNRTLSAAEILQLYRANFVTISSSGRVKIRPNLLTESSNTLNTNLIGYWTFDTANMTPNVVDSSGSGNTGYLINADSQATSTRYINPGKVAQAFYLGCVNTQCAPNEVATVKVLHNASLKPASAITVSAWTWLTLGSINDPTFGNTMEIMRKEDGTDRLLFSHQDGANCNPSSADGCISFGISTGGVYAELDVPTASSTWEGKWRMVTAVYDGATKSIYLDGQLLGSTPASGAIGTTGTADLYIGSLGGSAELFNGRVDDVRLYNKALSATDVLNLYNLTK